MKSAVFCRIRPFSQEGGHADTQEETGKKLDKFDDQSLHVSGKKYVFPRRVLLPESTQQEVFENVMPELLDAWTTQCRNCMFFCYGQTGTGKTHTMFGTPESLKSDELHPDWGLFPRVIDSGIKRMEAAIPQFPGMK